MLVLAPIPSLGCSKDWGPRGPCGSGCVAGAQSHSISSVINHGEFIWALPHRFLCCAFKAASPRWPTGWLQSLCSLAWGGDGPGSIPEGGVSGQSTPPALPQHPQGANTTLLFLPGGFSRCCSTRLDPQPCGSPEPVSDFPSLTWKTPAAQPPAGPARLLLRQKELF